MGYTFKAEYFLQDNVTIANHFFQDPFNPIPHPIQNRRRRHALLVASNQQQRTHDPIEVEENKIETVSTTDNLYEKYDVEAIEIDSGLTGNDTDDDFEYYGSETEKHDEDNDEEHDEDQDEDDDDHNEVHSTANYWKSRPNDFSTARWTIFKGIEMLVHKYVCRNFFIMVILLIRACDVLEKDYQDVHACCEVFVNVLKLHFPLRVEFWAN